MDGFWRIVEDITGAANGPRWQRNVFAIVAAGLGLLAAWRLGVFG